MCGADKHITFYVSDFCSVYLRLPRTKEKVFEFPFLLQNMHKLALNTSISDLEQKS